MEFQHPYALAQLEPGDSVARGAGPLEKFLLIAPATPHIHEGPVFPVHVSWLADPYITSKGFIPTLRTPIAPSEARSWVVYQSPEQLLELGLVSRIAEDEELIQLSLTTLCNEGHDQQ